MDDITIEKADYIVNYYSHLFTLNEKKALRHHRSTIKLEGAQNVTLTRMYLKTGWLSDDPLILNYLNDGYVQFILSCAKRVLNDHPEEVIFNNCPVCQKLTRTPSARQCRWCGHDWRQSL